MSSVDRDLQSLMKLLKKRLEQGEIQYGHNSWKKADLPKEVEEEVADLIAWGFFLYRKIQIIKRKTKCLKA